MTRGDASNPRTHDVRVRLNDDEHALWDDARAASGRKEMGAWVRAVITEMLTGERAPARPGDLPRVVLPEVNRDAVEQLRRVGNNLNQLTHRAHADGHAPALAELRRLLIEVEDALREVRGQRPVRVLAPPPVSTDRAAAAVVDVDDVDQDAEQLVNELSPADRAAAVLSRARGRAGDDAGAGRKWWRGVRS
jgi:uncharacterized membrane protein YccC